jgi:hypothetical protein
MRFAGTCSCPTLVRSVYHFMPIMLALRWRKRQNDVFTGPHLAGWEMYHLKGSPVDPNRRYASQYNSGSFGQVVQRSCGDGCGCNPNCLLFSSSRRQGAQ